MPHFLFGRKIKTISCGIIFHIEYPMLMVRIHGKQIA
nr:MAG TPA: hypothetical protein [Bacteriophage sp.]